MLQTRFWGTHYSFKAHFFMCSAETKASKVKVFSGHGVREGSRFCECSAPANAICFPQGFLCYFFWLLVFVFVVVFCLFVYFVLYIILTSVCSESEDVLLDSDEYIFITFHMSSSSPFQRGRSRGLEQEPEERHGDYSWSFGISVLAWPPLLILRIRHNGVFTW